MFKNIFTKTLYDKRSFMFGWSLGLAIMAGITIAFFPTIKDQIGTLFANVPKALESVTGTSEDYKNIVGYVATGVFDLRIPMLTITMAIILALGLSAGEESSGRLYQLLAQPVTRTKVVLQKWMAMTGIFFLTHVMLLIGIWMVIVLVGENMAFSKIWAGTLMCFLLTLASGSLTLALGFGLGRKGLTTVLITSYTFGSYLLTSFAAQIDWLKHVEPVSPFHYYKASDAIKVGLSLRHIIILLLITCIAVAIGTVLFNRRDIGTHNAS
ncbi:MAG: ABC transporter permease subunit [Candidatus Saccharimonadales bacterium]